MFILVAVRNEEGDGSFHCQAVKRMIEGLEKHDYSYVVEAAIECLRFGLHL